MEVKIDRFILRTYDNRNPKKGISLTVKDYVILVTNDNNKVVPNFIGLSINEAKTLLSYLDLAYEIEGNGYVKEQSISENTVITDEFSHLAYSLTLSTYSLPSPIKSSSLMLAI